MSIYVDNKIHAKWNKASRSLKYFSDLPSSNSLNHSSIEDSNDQSVHSDPNTSAQLAPLVNFPKSSQSSD